MIKTFDCEVGGRTLTIDTGKLAGQADGAVTVRYGDTMVLVTACVSSEPREGIDFLPLTIDYEERLYAAGKIPGGFIRREGRPSEEATLASRLTDRPLRPLLPKSWRNDIQTEIDIIKEVARIYGFSNIDQPPPRHINSKIPHHPIYLLEKEVRSRLIAAGQQEFITCNLIGACEIV